MDTEKFPTSFDVVIIGTGLSESIIAASLSRIGKKVLHIDRNDYYGGYWSTHSFDSLLKWAESYEDEDSKSKSAGEEEHCIPSFDTSVKNIEIQSFISELSPQYVPEDIKKESELNKNEACNEQNIERLPENKNIADKKEESQNLEPSDEGQHNTVKNDVTETFSEDKPDIKKTFNPSEKTDVGKDSEGACHNLPESSETPQIYKPPQPFNKPKHASIVSQAKIHQKSPDISLEDLKTLSRKFNLDLNPKFLFSAGPLVNAIIKANISHYSEFQIVNRILTCKNSEIIEVPCNRSDIFSSTFLSMIEKRTLMKFLTLCVEFDPDEPTDDLKEYLEKPFIEFLQSRRLSDNLQKFIVYSIAMVKPETKTLDGLKETCSFLKSLGRYGKSPFIWPLYGVGELPQAFCRMSAVFGSLYCLSKKATHFQIADDKCKKVVLEDQTIDCDFVVANRSYIPKKFVISNQMIQVSKAILITNGSILTSETETISFLTIPPLEGKAELVRVIELGPTAAACPNGLFVLYLCCVCTDTAFSDLGDYAKLLTSSSEDYNKPKLLWSIYFNELCNNEDIRDLPDNFFVTSMPGSSLGFKETVENAEEIVKSICPEGEFLMAVPNAEDIVWDAEPNANDEKSVDENQENKDEEDINKGEEASDIESKEINDTESCSVKSTDKEN